MTAPMALGDTAAASATLPPQADFARALLDPDLPVPDGVCCWNGSDPARRFAVYRNNVVVSLVDALSEQFEVTRALVGDEFFRAMARDYVRQRPPQSRLLVFAGEGFADFVQQFAPAGDLPYLADVVRLEMARIRSCHAADAPVLPREVFLAVLADPEQLADTRAVFHPSVFLLRSEHAVFSLWAAHQGAFDIGGVDPSEAQQLLVWRDEAFDVQTMVMPRSGHDFLQRLHGGAKLLQAANEAAAADPDFDLQAAMVPLVQHPLLTRMEA